MNYKNVRRFVSAVFFLTVTSCTNALSERDAQAAALKRVEAVLASNQKVGASIALIQSQTIDRGGWLFVYKIVTPNENLLLSARVLEDGNIEVGMTEF